MKQWPAYLPRLEAADSLLQAKRETILSLAPNFDRGRARLRQVPPQTYWWWYLDQPTAPNSVQAATGVLPSTCSAGPSGNCGNGNS